MFSISFIILAIIGFCISLYAYVVERNIKNNPSYKPACDLSDRISCSKPIQSQWGSLFFVSNSIVGMGYYALIAVLTLLHLHTLLCIITFMGWIISIGLAYILYVKIKALCLVCTALYFINTALIALCLITLLRAH